MNARSNPRAVPPSREPVPMVFSGLRKPSLPDPAHGLGDILNLLSCLDKNALLAHWERLVRQTGCSDYALWTVEPVAKGDTIALQVAEGKFSDQAFQSLFNAAAPPSVRTLRSFLGGASLCVPMEKDGIWFGRAAYHFPRMATLSNDLRELLLQLTQFTQVAWFNACRYEHSQAMSLADPLTRIGNRRALDQRLTLEIARVSRFGHPFCLLMVDVDHFKGFNDRVGHLGGDEALRGIAAYLRDQLRLTDMVSRYGGDEFCILLSNTDEASGRAIGEKLCHAVGKLTLDVGGFRSQGELSISIGLAVCPIHVHPARPQAHVEILRVADVALYEAKHRGRNCLASFSECSRNQGATGADTNRMKPAALRGLCSPGEHQVTSTLHTRKEKVHVSD